MKTPLLVLVSGGRSSAMQARHIQTSPKYKDFEKLYVFCNTGMERPETIQFLKNIVNYWQIPLHIIEGVYSMERGIGVKSKLVDFDTMDMDGNVFSQSIQHFNKNKIIGVPNKATPFCTHYLKVLPTKHFAKEVFVTTKFITAIGFRKEDMPKRISWAEIKEDKKRIFPLITDFVNPISLIDLAYFFDKQPFKLSIPSDLGNCELCWKKSERNLIKAIQRGTRFIDWHKKHELQYGNMFFRKNLSIDDLVRMAEKATETQQLKLFSDVGESCSCGTF